MPRAFNLHNLFALFLGASHAFAFAPRTGWWLQLAALIGLWCLQRQNLHVRQAAWHGWLFGMGWFCCGIWWLYISMHTYGGMPWPIAALAVLLLAAGLSLFPAGVLAISYWFRRHRKAGWDWVQPLTFASLWAVSEWLRGTLFTGFPWLVSGYAHTDGPLSNYAPLIGVYGLSWLAALLAAWLSAALLRTLTGHRDGLPPLLCAIVLLLGGWLVGKLHFTHPQGQALEVRLLQGNIPQDIKFQENMMSQSLLRYRDLITAQPADLIITPETAFPLFLDDMPPALMQTLYAYVSKSGSALLFGAAGLDSPTEYTNSMFGIRPLPTQPSDAPPRPTLDARFRYDKHHLVPFGEFIPPGFHWFVAMMNMPLGDFKRGPVVQPPFAVKDQLIGVNICYEDAFGEEIARTLRESPTPATILANATNIAWFGDTVAIDQHLQISRMRALETGRPMLRATNTGATAIIGPDGVVQAHLKTMTVGVLHAHVQGMQGMTPYIRFGNWPVLLLSLLSLSLAILATRKGREVP